MKSNIRAQVFLWSHRWFGIVAGLYFVMFGISGSYLVFDDEFDAWLYPARYQSELPSLNFNLEKLVRSAQRGFETDRLPTRLTLPADPTRNATLIFNLANPGEPQELKFAAVDPSSNSFKDAYTRLGSLGGILFTFHHDLFLGAATARLWMGISALFLLAILLSGLCLWWPAKKQLRRSLSWPTFRGLLKSSLDLHKLFGIYSFVLMIAVTFSGFYICVPGWFAFGEKKGGPASINPSPPADMPVIDYAVLEKMLAEHGLLQRPLRIAFNAREGNIQIRGREGDPTSIYDPAKSSLTVQVDESKPAFEMRRLQRSVHGGDYWGILGKILTFIAGLLPLFFYITGIYVWWKRRTLRSSSL